MKKLIITALLLLSLSFSASAQDITTILLTMPESIVFGLEASQKDLLIADIKDTANITVDRGPYGNIKRLEVSSDFIALKTSEAGTTQIKLLPLINDSKIICVIKTVCNTQKVCDSQMQFYTTKWIPISQADLLPKKNKDWFIKEDIDRNNQDFINAYAALNMAPIKYILSPNDTFLKAEHCFDKYLSEEDYKKLQPYLIDGNKVLLWDKISYKMKE